MSEWTIKKALEWTEGYLADKGDENPRLSAQWLLSEACGLSRTQLFINFDRPLSEDERGVLRGYVRRRGAGEPLQYITGEVAFRHITVKVRPGVLIPRPETEVLVSEVLAALPTPGPRDVAWNPEAAEQEREAVAAVKKALEEAGESASLSVGGDLGRPSAADAATTREGGASTAPTEGMRNGVAATGSTPVGGDLGRPSVPKGCPVPITEAFTDAADTVAHLAECVLEGRKAPVATATERLLETHDGLAIINDIFVPILDVVGQKYDEGAFFLPQLMASAEAVKAGFDLIRDRARAVGASAAEATPVGGDLGRPSGSSAVTPRKGCASPAPTEDDAHVPAESDRAIIVATVQGDIHDIGKNIVKMLLENYGFTVIDLGRDVAPEAIVAAARDTGARLIGLSALMTTTVGAMERTIALVHEQLPGVAVMVGGAVITQEFAEQIGADFYAKDAAASTRVASTFFDD